MQSCSTTLTGRATETVTVKSTSEPCDILPKVTPEELAAEAPEHEVSLHNQCSRWDSRLVSRYTVRVEIDSTTGVSGVKRGTVVNIDALPVLKGHESRHHVLPHVPHPRQDVEASLGSRGPLVGLAVARRFDVDVLGAQVQALGRAASGGR